MTKTILEPLPHSIATLPPDPEGVNDRRAAWAAAALQTFRDATGADADDALADLIADLMHWCDRNGMDIDRQLQRGRCHYAAETAAEPADKPSAGEPASGNGASPQPAAKKHRVTIIAKTIETYEVEADNPNEAEELWCEGRLVDADDNIENEILRVEPI